MIRKQKGNNGMKNLFNTIVQNVHWGI